MIVEEIDHSNSEKLKALAKIHGNIFWDSNWLGIFDGIKIYGVFTKKSNDLIGGFCLYKDSKFGFTYFTDLPFVPHCCLFYSNKVSNPANYSSFRKKVFNAIGDFLLKQRHAIINISFPQGEVDMQPLIWKGMRMKIRYTYQIELTQDEKVIYSNFSPERRNDISKAIKDGLIAKEVSQYDEVEDLVLKTFEFNGIQRNSKFVMDIFKKFATRENSIAMVAYKDNKPSACSFVVFNQNVAYYILGGYSKENRHHGAGAFCLWEIIKIAKGRGINVFDFEGSMIPSIESFFRGFGGTLVPFFQVRKYPFLPNKIIK